MPRPLTTFLDGHPVGWLETLEQFQLLDQEQAWYRPDKTVIGTPGDDKLHGGQGNDDIDGLAGADTMAGRLGDDTFHVDDLGDVVKERAGEGIDTVLSDVDFTLGSHVENLFLRGPNQMEDLIGIGNELDNLIVGNGGENRLEGLGGNDVIKSGGTVGPFESDTLLGGLGDDTLIGGTGYITSDLLRGGGGNDVLQVTSGANVLDGGSGNDLLTGGSGNGQHFPAFDTLIGGNGKDTLEGGESQSGGDGNDQMHFNVAYHADGGAGDDTIEGAGGGGFDDLDVSAGLGNDFVNVVSVNNDLHLDGGEGNDTLAGSANQDVFILAGAGDDEVTAIQYTNASVNVDAGEGNDTVTAQGKAGTVTLTAGAGDDLLHAATGLGLGQWLSGGDGNDTLSVGQGVSFLHGDGGSDRFVLAEREVNGANMVTVSDFASGLDLLTVRQGSLPVGDGDLVVDGAVTVNGPGGFGAGAELVIVSADISGDLTLDKAAAAIGSANGAYADGQTVVFMVDNGVQSWALYFESDGTDAAVSVAELSLLARLTGTPSTDVNDITWGA
jgi:Ca2+-binding RTX toxin-like protein